MNDRYSSQELIAIFLKCVATGLAMGVIFGPLVGWISPEVIGLIIGVGDPIRIGLALGIINGMFYGFLAAVAIAIFSRKPTPTCKDRASNPREP